MVKIGETGARTEKQRNAARRSSSRWKQRARSRRAARSRSGAVRKGAPAGPKKKASGGFRLKAPRVGRILSGLRSDDTSLPGWRDLSGVKGRASSRPSSGAFLEDISTGRFVIMLLLVALGATLYVGHIHATQTLVADLEQAQRENLELHLQHNRLRGDFDRVTGPAVLFERARELGLEEDVAYRPTLTIRND